MLGGEQRNTLQIARLYVSGTFLNVTRPIGQLATALGGTSQT